MQISCDLGFKPAGLCALCCRPMTQSVQRLMVDSDCRPRTGSMVSFELPLI